MKLGTATQWRAWIKRGWPWWVFLVSLGVGLLWWKLAPGIPDTLRHIGLLFEILGVFAVGAEFVIAMKRHEVGLPHVRVVAYFRQAPIFGRTVSVVGSVGRADGIGVAFSLVGGALTSAVPLTFEQRLDIIEGQLKGMSDGLNAANRRIDAEAAARTAALSDQARRTERVVAEIKVMHKDIETGSLNLAVPGLVLLFLGMVLTTGTPEVCRWVVSGCQ